MAKVIIHNKYCQLQEENSLELIRKLDDTFSYFAEGYQYTAAFRGYFKGDQFIKWDGKNRILNEKLEFPVGLLSRLKDFYYNNNEQLEIVDCRSKKSSFESLDISERLKEIGKIPRQHQLDALEAVKNNDRGILKLCTGSGKTLLAALITAYFNKSTIIYVIGTDLLYQFHELFKQIFGDDVGIIGDGHCQIKNINILSIWTAGQALGLKKIAEDYDDVEKKIGKEKYQDIRKLLKVAKVHILDECHTASCATLQEINKYIDPEYIYGMSGSPWKGVEEDILVECILGQPIINVTASQLIKKDLLVKPYIKFIKVPTYQGNEKQYQTLYKNYIVDNEIRNNYVLKSAKGLVDAGYKTLVLYNSIEHGRKLFDLISPEIPTALLSGKDPKEERDKIKSQIEDGTIKCIIASKIFDIGVDIPCLSGLILAGPNKSSVRAIQRIGRVLRTHPGKKRVQVIDYLDDCPVLVKHSAARKKIYQMEEEFVVEWPKKK